MSFLGEVNFSHEDKQKVGVIICNLGSPDSYSTKDVRKYLREFLSDTRVIEVPKICLLYTSPSPRDMRRSRMPSSA